MLSGREDRGAAGQQRAGRGHAPGVAGLRQAQREHRCDAEQVAEEAAESTTERAAEEAAVAAAKAIPGWIANAICGCWRFTESTLAHGRLLVKKIFISIGYSRCLDHRP